MSAAVRERLACARAPDGRPARRAVIGWAWRIVALFTGALRDFHETEGVA